MSLSPSDKVTYWAFLDSKNLVYTFWSHKPSAIPVEDVAEETRSEPPQIVQELGHDDDDNNDDENEDNV